MILFVLTYNYRNLNLDTPEEWKNLNPNARHHRCWWSRRRKWTKVSCCNYFLTGILFSFMILFILYSYNFSTVYNFITPAQQQIFAILFVLTNYYRNLRLSYNFSIVHLAIFLRTYKYPPLCLGQSSKCFALLLLLIFFALINLVLCIVIIIIFFRTQKFSVIFWDWKRLCFIWFTLSK